MFSRLLVQYQRVTDGRTDGRTDVQPIAKTCFSIADARKNQKVWTTFTDSKLLNGFSFSFSHYPYIYVSLRVVD